MQVKVGQRLESQVSSTQVVVVRGDGDFDLRCGGIEMVSESLESPTARDGGGLTGETLIGKRYVLPDGDENQLELLCVQAGDGALTIGERELAVKQTRPMPASD